MDIKLELIIGYDIYNLINKHEIRYWYFTW